MVRADGAGMDGRPFAYDSTTAFGTSFLPGMPDH